MSHMEGEEDDIYFCCRKGEKKTVNDIKKCPICDSDMIKIEEDYYHCSNKQCPNSKPIQPHKCSGCGEEFEPWQVRDLQWAGIDILSSDKNYSLWLLHPKKVGTYCQKCCNKLEEIFSTFNREKEKKQ